MKEKGTNVDLYIVYDKETKMQAKALSNKLVEKNYKCVTWDERTYEDNENKVINTNVFLLFSQSLIEENIPDETAKSRTISNGVSLLSIGNMHGIIIDPKAEDSFLGSNWWKYVMTLSKIIGMMLPIFLLIKNPVKKIKIKLYFDAVKFLIKDDNIKLIIPD